MRCPACGHENPSDARFCNQCGTRAAATGSAPAPAPAAYTPRHLAEKILTSRAALEGQRKQLTVLFADVQGSMELAEQVDPEEWHAILDRFFAILTEGVHRFEGTVNQYTGDGIMALFGAPIAHEDHAQRACWAALHLADALRRYARELRLERGLGFSVRIGLNSGEVVVGTIGDDLRMDYTAQGRVVGLAARMEQLAEPGKIYLTEHTAALVTGFFQLEELGPIAIKGTSEPVKVFELLGSGPLRTRLDRSRARGFTRFVGRDEEMAVLEAALTRALDGQGQVVGVVGEPGTGKSRLCFEFVQRCRARGLPVYEARGVAHGKNVPFLTLLEYLRGYFGIDDQDTPQVTREKIAGRVLLLDPEVAEALPLLFDLLGVPDPDRPSPRIDPDARQRRLFDVMTRLTQAQSRREPGVSLIEDLHWIDGATEQFIANFVDAVAGTRALLVVNFRPEYQAAWMEKSYYRRLPVLPLDAAAIASLLHELLGDDASLAGVAEHVHARTGGNPFFIEEVVQGLAESGHLAGEKGAYRLARPIDANAIPASVQAVLAARIDRLPEVERVVLQTAAVVGKEFAEPVLRHVTASAAPDLPAALRVLVRGEFLYEAALFPEAVYAFKHPLTQEVAYRSQLAARRAEVHGVVARTLVALYPDKLDERAALLAHHWEGAGDALEAARWSRRAAEWAGQSNVGEAMRHWRKVRELLAKMPVSPETVDLGLAAYAGIVTWGFRVGYADGEVEAAVAAGRALAARSTDRRAQARLVWGQGVHAVVTGHVARYAELAREAAVLAEPTADLGVKLNIDGSVVYATFLLGRLPEALEYADQALARATGDASTGAELSGNSPYIFLVMLRGLILTESGRFAEASREHARCEQLAHEHRDLENLGWTCGNRTIQSAHTGEIEAGLHHAARCMEVAERIGSRFSLAGAYRTLGIAHVSAERWAEAIADLDQALVITREYQVGLESEAYLHAVLAEACLGCGDMVRARRAADEAIELAEHRGARVYESRGRLARARVLRASEGLGARTAIEDELKRTQALVQETGALAMLPFVHLEWAALADLTGAERTRERELLEAHRLFLEMGATRRAADLHRRPGG